MIIDDIVNIIYNKRRKIMLEENRDSSFVIYIGEDYWKVMMDELIGYLPSVAYDVYQNHGKRIMGFPIYRVISPEHGIQVFEL